jgi:hypothetical protein
MDRRTAGGDVGDQTARCADVLVEVGVHDDESSAARGA